MMQILINLSDSVYDAIKNKYTLVNPKEGTLIKTLWDAVKNGTPLPKGHGDLIDRDEVEKLGERLCATECDCCTLDGCFYDRAEAIIEADRSRSEE